MSQGPVTVPTRAANERLDVYLAKTLMRPRNQIAKLIKDGEVAINGHAERPSYLVQAGDLVNVNEREIEAIKLEAPNLPVVYEDDDLLVVNKPSGIAAHAGAGDKGRAGGTVADFARPRTTDPDLERPGIVHRLDRDTSGLMIIAKNPAAKAYLQAAFKRRRVKKTYELLVVGRLPHDEAVIDLPIGRNPAKPLQQAVVGGSRKASTGYRTVRYYPGYSLVEAKPLSGRTHQIRVHFAAIGHPVAGDTTYGPPKRQLGLKRQFLHAAVLEFTAPSGDQLKLTSQLPGDLKAALSQLESTGA